MDSERVGFKITQLALINWSIGYKRVMFDCGVLHFGFVFFLRFNKDRKKSLQCIQNLYYRYSDSQTHYRNQVAIVHKSTFSPSVGHKPTWGVRLIRLWNWPLYILFADLQKKPRCWRKKTMHLKHFQEYIWYFQPAP